MSTHEGTESGRLLRGVLRRLPWAVLAAVVVGLLGYMWAGSKPKQYQATTIVSVTGQGYASQFVTGSAVRQDNVEVDSAQAIAQITLPNVLVQARGLLIDRGGMQAVPTRAQIADATTVSTKADTGLVSVAVRSERPADAQRISQAVAEAFVAKRQRDESRQIDAALSSARAQYDSLTRAERDSDVGAAARIRVQQLQVAQRAATGGVALIQGANLPTDAVAPRPLRGALAGFFIAGLLALGIIVLRAAMDDRLRDAAAFDEVWGEPALAAVPRVSRFGHRGGANAPRPVSDEALAMTALALRHAGLGTSRASLAIASALDGEGKSTIAWHLAEFLGKGGARVLLVDGDMRERTVTRWAAAQGHSGFANLLGRDERVDVVTHGAFDVLPAGVQGGDTHLSQLNTENVSAAMGPFELAYDVVIIDTPPAVPFADAIAIGRACDGFLVIGRIDRTTRTAAARLAYTTDDFRARRVGYVINAARGGHAVPRYGGTGTASAEHAAG